MDFKLTKEQQELREQFEAFFREEMKNAPICYQIHSGLEAMYDTDEGFAFHRYMQKKLAAKGWLTMAWPKAYGGREAPIIEQAIFNEARSYYRAPGVDAFGLGMFAPTLMLFASEVQKEAFPPSHGRGQLLSRMERTQCGIGSGIVKDHRHQGRRSLCPQWAEDLDQRRAPGRPNVPSR